MLCVLHDMHEDRIQLFLLYLKIYLHIQYLK